MNISSVSLTPFAGKFSKPRKVKPEPTPEEQAKREQAKARRAHDRKKCGQGFLAGAGLTAAGIYMIPVLLHTALPAQPVSLPYNQGVTDTSVVAEALDVSPESIVVSEDGKVMKIPVEFDYLGDEINEAREGFFEQHLIDTSSDSLEDRFLELSKMVEQRKFQKQTAVGYIEDGKVHYEIIAENGISVDDFEKLFDIREGALPENNSNIIYDITKGGYCTDTEDGKLTKGITVVVDENDINSLF